jgi:hypothetical protein
MRPKIVAAALEVVGVHLEGLRLGDQEFQFVVAFG